MRRFLTTFFIAFMFIFTGSLLHSCSPAKRTGTTKEEEKKTPSNPSISPSSFHCTVKVLSAGPDEIHLRITRVMSRGSSLIYPVGDGDTLTARNLSAEKITMRLDSISEMLLEERLKLNSGTPDFIITKIYSTDK